MRRLGSLSFWVLSALLALPTDAVAQARPCDPARQICLAGTEFREHFYGDSPVRASGNLVVGVSLAGDGSFQPSNIGVSLAALPSTGRLCLGVASRDGRYFAENLYRVPSVRTAQTTFHFPSAYTGMIAAYRHGDVAVLIRDTDRCEGASFGTVVPAVEGRGPHDRLRVFLNAPATRTRVSLRADNTPIATAGCEADTSRNSLTFSAICTLALPPGPLQGPYELVVHVRERTATDDTPVPLRLDRP